MSSRPWKDTNSRDKTNNKNTVIQCDELITDELTTKNATFKLLNVRQKVTTNNFDVSNVDISNTMTVPDICINNITNSAVKFKSPFSAPYAVFKDVRVNDTSKLFVVTF